MWEVHLATHDLVEFTFIKKRLACSILALDLVERAIEQSREKRRPFAAHVWTQRFDVGLKGLPQTVVTVPMPPCSLTKKVVAERAGKCLEHLAEQQRLEVGRQCLGFVPVAVRKYYRRVAVACPERVPAPKITSCSLGKRNKNVLRFPI